MPDIVISEFMDETAVREGLAGLDVVYDPGLVDRPDELIGVLKQERIAEDLRISFRLRIEERGTEYRVSLVPRRSGEFKVQE